MRYSTQKIIQRVAIGLGGIAIVGTAAIGVVYLLIQNHHKTTIPNESIGTQQDFDFSYADSQGVKHEIPGLKISQYETVMNGAEIQKNNQLGLPSTVRHEYFLNQEGISYLVKRFFETGNFGPEIFNLKKIWIGNVNFTSNLENGVYIGATDEIGLNAANFADSLNAASSFAYGNPYDSSFRSLYQVYTKENLIDNQKIRAELLFQTLAHEYGHHLAHAYVSSPFNPNRAGDYTNVFIQNSATENVPNRVNKNFLASFKDIFKYNDDEKLIANPKDTDFLNGEKPAQFTTSIGAIYSTKNAWDIANSQSHASPINWKDLGYNHLGFNYFNYYKKPSEFNQQNFDPSQTAYSYGYTYAKDDSDLTYLYSAEELFTRKELLSSTTLDPETFEPLVRNRVKFDVLDDESRYETPAMGKKTLQNRTLIDTKNIALDTTPNAAVYMKDSPFVQTSETNQDLVAKTYMESINQYIGHSTGDDISYIWQENNFKVASRGQAQLDGEVNTNNIKFGGYISDKDFNTIGYYTRARDGSSVWHEVSPINVEKFSLGYKTTLFGSTRHEVEGTDKYFYATNNFVDKRGIVNKELYFGKKDTNGNVSQTSPLQSARMGAFGTASTYQEMLPKALRSTNYVIPVSTNGNIALQDINIPGEWGGA